MQSPAQLAVTVHHDAAAGVWYVQDSQLPGLHAEAATLDALVATIEEIAPDLIESNLPRASDGTVPPITICLQHVVTPKQAHAA